MDTMKDHWNRIYATKKSNEVSWTEEVPLTSLTFIHGFALSKTAAIIDVGGGESKLVDHLLAEGFTNITVLDISEEAIAHARQRLGRLADRVTWIVSDITEFIPTQQYDVWHDRATFHFLTRTEQVEQYVALASKALTPHGYMTIGTFSENGPTKCSGLDIKQYSGEAMQVTLRGHFSKVRCIHENHVTPFRTVQNFLFCSFLKTAA